MNKMLRQVVGLLYARVEYHIDGSVKVYDADNLLICDLRGEQIERIFLDKNMRYRLMDGKHAPSSAWRKSTPLDGDYIIRQNWGADFLTTLQLMRRSVEIDPQTPPEDEESSHAELD